MKISVNFSALGKTRWYEYAVRFLLGGAVTVIAGILAKRYGPVFGGLFLAFPAIFPASATLVEKHERQKKQRAGIAKTVRGQQAAGVDAAGAALGSVGLAVFALVIWKLLPAWNVGGVFTTAILAWLCVSVTLWRVRKKHWLHS
jgi:Protein of unknown function (DUF3147)